MSPLAAKSHRAPSLHVDERAIDEALRIQRHAYQVHRAEPEKAASAHLQPADYARMTGAGRVHTLGSGDVRPLVPRAGSMQAAQYPSRQGDRLHWPDGRVTTLSGTVLPIVELSGDRR